jgi:thiamine pyrophosphokinase
MRIYTDTQVLEYVKDREIIITGKSGQHCGIMAFPKAKMTTQGLKYDTDNYDLEYGFSESISNALNQESATLKIQGEALIIYSHPYSHPATSSTADQNPD